MVQVSISEKSYFFKYTCQITSVKKFNVFKRSQERFFKNIKSFIHNSHDFVFMADQNFNL